MKPLVPTSSHCWSSLNSRCHPPQGKCHPPVDAWMSPPSDLSSNLLFLFGLQKRKLVLAFSVNDKLQEKHPSISAWKSLGIWGWGRVPESTCQQVLFFWPVDSQHLIPCSQWKTSGRYIWNRIDKKDVLKKWTTDYTSQLRLRNVAFCNPSLSESDKNNNLLLENCSFANISCRCPQTVSGINCFSSASDRTVPFTATLSTPFDVPGQSFVPVDASSVDNDTAFFPPHFGMSASAQDDPFFVLDTSDFDIFIATAKHSNERQIWFSSYYGAHW